MTRLAVIALTVTLIACAGSRAERGGSAEPQVKPAPTGTGDMATAGAPGGQASAMPKPSDMSRMCPMDVPDTTIPASDTPQGEALTFATTSGQVDELRQRVRALADMHNQHVSTAAPAPGPGEPQGTGSAAGTEGAPHGHHMMPPPSRATVEDVDNGARVSIAPLNPSQADQLRAAVRMHAMHMQQHGCAMMHGDGAHR